ncbi:uncharacterized protein EAF01_008580 [Botrytis porri]|uniref:uncharacterized protein n=1 Tax=Botrytis porri TaxID=87229 RepID=UPI001901DCD0|nr:uncharacterized protein EAF01_008580 [Botrytis porri]KAF7899367.1 hypothetical protein EAF01_008580 [Botrytis porri]
MVQGHEKGSTFSESSFECINLTPQNSVHVQGSHRALSLDVDAPFHSPDSRKIHRSRHYVKWGIAWQPLWFMILLVLCGYALAIGHHFYFSSLGRLAGSPLRKQWAISRNRSSLITCTCHFGRAISIVSLVSNATSYEISHDFYFFSYRLVALAATAPPAALSVVPGISIERQPAEVPTIDWISEGFYYPRFDPIARPTAELSALSVWSRKYGCSSA